MMFEKYINTNILCVDSNGRNILRGLNFSELRSSVSAKKKEEKFVVGGFDIVVFLNIRGTSSKNDSDNPVDNGGKLFFRIRLTKLDGDKNKRLSYDIKDFEVDLSKEKKHESCFLYYEEIMVVHINDLEINEKGAYTVKLLVKDSPDQKKPYNVHMTHNIYFN